MDTQLPLPGMPPAIPSPVETRILSEVEALRKALRKAVDALGRAHQDLSDTVVLPGGDCYICDAVEEGEALLEGVEYA